MGFSVLSIVSSGVAGFECVRGLQKPRKREEAMIGEAGVAAPIFDRRSEPIGAIGVAGPSERVLKRGREQSVPAAVIEAARAISRDLGAPRWPAT
jgi:transcriptional regulator